MLLSSKRHYCTPNDENAAKQANDWEGVGSVKQFLTTSRKIVQFSSGRAPKVFSSYSDQDRIETLFRLANR